MAPGTVSVPTKNSTPALPARGQGPGWASRTPRSVSTWRKRIGNLTPPRSPSGPWGWHSELGCTPETRMQNLLEHSEALPVCPVPFRGCCGPLRPPPAVTPTAPSWVLGGGQVVPPLTEALGHRYAAGRAQWPSGAHWTRGQNRVDSRRAKEAFYPFSSLLSASRSAGLIFSTCMKSQPILVFP